MAQDLIKKVENTGIYVSQGDITRMPADAIITAINSGGMWFGGIDGAIQRAAGNHYHAQASKAMPLEDLQTVVAKGNRRNHKGQFDNVVFVVDDLQTPLDNVVYTGLEAASEEGYQKVLLPTIRMGVMLGQVEKTPQEAVERMSNGVREFMGKYGKKTRIEDLRFVVYNDPRTATMLRDGLETSFGDTKKSAKSKSPQRGELQIGEMPKPQYLVTAGDTTGSGDIQWIGMKAYDLGGEVRDFLWWRNFQVNLNNKKGRHDAASFIARLKLEADAESAIGLPVDLHSSDQRRNYVAVVEDPKLSGVYIEAQKRPMFNFMTMMNGVRSEDELRSENPGKFNELLEKAMAYLPSKR
jgi:O-acetyl-ADP-ribose deacetylase